MQKIRFGVLSTATIARDEVIPAMQQGEFTEITAIASRSVDKARKVAGDLNISTVHDSYDALLADENIDAVYIPLPNSMHVPWVLKAMEHGKHVLCEKPMGMSGDEIRQVLAAMEAHPELKVMEGFMYRFHPQWAQTKRLVAKGELGHVTSIQSTLSAVMNDPENIRNKPETGGGALRDMGCYLVSLSRFLYDGQPKRVLGYMDMHPKFGTDRAFSGILDFDRHVSTFTCSSQLTLHQHVKILGSRGRIEIPVPFNPAPDEPAMIVFEHEGEARSIQYDPCDKYTLQGDAFARAILEDTPVPTPITDALENQLVVDALLESAEKNQWIEL